MTTTYVPFVPDTMVAQWHTPWPIPTPSVPPVGAPLRTFLVKSRKPTSAEAATFNQESFGVPMTLVIGHLPIAGLAPGNYGSVFVPYPAFGSVPTDVTVFEFPAGTNQWYLPLWCNIVGRGKVNEHRNIYLCPIWLALTHEKV